MSIRRKGTCKACHQHTYIHIQHLGWCAACYTRWVRAGHPEDGPPPKQQPAPWRPTSKRGLDNLALYDQLVAERATPARIRRELGVGERQVQRYAAAWRTLQQQEQGTQ